MQFLRNLSLTEYFKENPKRIRFAFPVTWIYISPLTFFTHHTNSFQYFLNIFRYAEVQWSPEARPGWPLDPGWSSPGQQLPSLPRCPGGTPGLQHHGLLGTTTAIIRVSMVTAVVILVDFLFTPQSTLCFCSRGKTAQSRNSPLSFLTCFLTFPHHPLLVITDSYVSWLFYKHPIGFLLDLEGIFLQHFVFGLLTGWYKLHLYIYILKVAPITIYVFFLGPYYFP